MQNSWRNGEMIGAVMESRQNNISRQAANTKASQVQFKKHDVTILKRGPDFGVPKGKYPGSSSSSASCSPPAWPLPRAV
nr:uncharacterized protein LOC108080112 isoform X2 [Drosophila kikkawai]